MNAVEGVAQLLVELYHYALGHLGYGGDVAYAGAYYHGAVVLDVADFDYGEVYVTYEAVAQFLGGLREVEVEVVCVVRVDALAQVGMALVRCASAYRVGSCQDAVTLVGCRCSGDDVDLEWFALGVQLFGFGGYGLGDHFGSPGGCESGESAVAVIVEKVGGLFGSENRESHCDEGFILCFCLLILEFPFKYLCVEDRLTPAGIVGVPLSVAG